MRNVSADKIEDCFAAYQGSGATSSIAFDPIQDGKIVFLNYTERALARQQAKIVSLTTKQSICKQC